MTIAQLALENPAALDDTLDRAGVRALRKPGTPGALLVPLLGHLGWRGDLDGLIKALPYFADELDLRDLRNALTLLGYRTTPRQMRLDDIKPDLAPLLFECGTTGEVLLIATGRDGSLSIHRDGSLVAADEQMAARHGTAYLVSHREDASATEAAASDWFANALSRFKTAFHSLLLISLVTNLLAIATPLFVMVVYDRVVGQHSLGALPYLAGGIVIVLIADLGFRLARARLLAHVAGRLDYLLGISTFQKLLDLPLAYTERSAVSTQISRLKEFETLRDFFTGPLASAATELPFVVLMIVAIALIAGPLAVVPVIAALALAGFTLLRQPGNKSLERAVGKSTSLRQNLIVETVMHQDTLGDYATEDTWLDRFRLISAKANRDHERLQSRTAVAEAFGAFVMNMAAMATLVFGALMVLQQSLSVGALIACMALTWRILTPLQTALQASSKLGQIRNSIGQINQLFKLRGELRTRTGGLLKPPQHGSVIFERASLRYGRESDPALLGASFKVPAGSILAIVGTTGAGKSSILKSILGLFTPQGGRILIDGTDIRQLDARDLRRTIAYAPQNSDLYYGTIRQNLTIGDPTTEQADIDRALRLTGLDAMVASLPEGLETRIGDVATGKLAVGFARRMTLARALVRRSPLLLLDEPEQALDSEGDQMMIDLLRALKRKQTVIIVTHRPSYARIADQVAVLRDGQVDFVGAPDEALPLVYAAPGTKHSHSANPKAGPSS